jgi:hypothetical protein
MPKKKKDYKQINLGVRLPQQIKIIQIFHKEGTTIKDSKLRIMRATQVRQCIRALISFPVNMRDFNHPILRKQMPNPLQQGTSGGTLRTTILEHTNHNL